MARKRIMCVKRTPKHEDPYRYISHVGVGAGAGFSKVLLVEEVDGAPSSNHWQGGGEHKAQFLMGVA